MKKYIINIGDNMRKLNNKGFAVSIILYSIIAVILLIFMITVSVYATNLHNKTSQVDNIKERISKLDLAE